MSSPLVSAAWHARMTLPDGPEGLCVANGHASKVLCTYDLTEVPALIEQAHNLAKRGMAVVGGLAYEAAPAFDASLPVHANPEFPLLEFHAFNADQIEFWPTAKLQVLGNDGQFFPWLDTQQFSEYSSTFEAVRQAIEEGEFYQINLTTRLKSYSNGQDAWAVFQHLYLKQAAPQSVFLRGSVFNAISLSPELFFTGTERPCKRHR